MIHYITSSLPSYKSMDFTLGLNVVVAEKSSRSSRKHTRNSAGKTCLVEVIHFLLGADATRTSMFRQEPLKPHSFTMQFDLGGSVATVTRCGKSYNEICLKWRPLGNLAHLFSEFNFESEKVIVSVSRWNEILGKVMFGIEIEEKTKFGPSWRMVFGYFARRQRLGGFLDWNRSQEKMQPWQQFVAIALLLGLDWKIPQKVRTSNVRVDELAKLKKLSSGEVLDDLIGKPGTLRSLLALAKTRVQRLQSSLDSFQVHEQYEELEQEANLLVRQFEEMSNNDFVDRKIISNLQETFDAEISLNIESIHRLYGEVKLLLPEVVKRRFEEVRSFHESIVQNRRRYLRSEIKEAQERIAQRAESKFRLDKRKSDIMKILRSHGALAQYNELREDLARAQVEKESLELRLDRSIEIGGKQAKLARQRFDLRDMWQTEVRDKNYIIASAAVLFRDITSMLFNEYGRFEVHEELGKKMKNVPFQVTRHGDEGAGVGSMLMFSFDMMLTVFCEKFGRSPGFLIHDSHIFDSAEERQVGSAIDAGRKLAETYGFQYIVTMNTDKLDVPFPPGFDISRYLNPVRLNDDEDGGGLFGVRFDRRRDGADEEDGEETSSGGT